MEKSKRRDRISVLRVRLETEQTRLLYYIDDAANLIESLSAGEIYSAYGAEAVKRLDALTNAEEALSTAIGYLDRAINPKSELSEAN